MLVSTLTTLREIKFDFSASQDDDIRRAVIKTLAYFDLFDYPLTDWEIYKYLWVKDLEVKGVNYIDVKRILDNGLPDIQRKEGFYFLDGRKHLVSLRKQRQNIANKKYKKVRWAMKILSAMPFVRMLAVCNSLAYDNARDESDIDLFIITAKNKIWTSRFYANLLLRVFNLRPKKDDKKDKICLNFFISDANLLQHDANLLIDANPLIANGANGGNDANGGNCAGLGAGKVVRNEDHLNLQNLMIKDDIYFIYWFKLLTPVYDQGNIFNQLTAQNKWLNEFLNTEIYRTNNLRQMQVGVWVRMTKWILEKLNSFGFMEKIYQRFQMEIMPKNILEKMNKNTEVVVNDRVLKFHVDDDREEFRDRWEDYVKCKT